MILQFYILVSLGRSQSLEYRLWKNYGQLIYDYSNNNHYGWNGRNEIEDAEDCLFTDRGAYLNYKCRVMISNFKSPNPFSVVIWAVSDDSVSNGRLFCRYH